MKKRIPMKIATHFIFIALLINNLSYHALIHGAAEENSLQERLIQNNPNAYSQNTLNRQLLFATFTGDLETVQHALEAGANPNALGKHDCCNNRMTQCLLSYHPDCWYIPIAIIVMSCFAITLITPVVCAFDFASHKPNITPDSCVAITLSPALMVIYCLAKLTYHEYENIEHSCCWKRKIIYKIGGKTPLIVAAQRANSRKPAFNQIIQLLLDYNADINGTDAKGNTPLMAAVAHNNGHAVKIVGLAGADTRCTNIYGHSALDIGQTSALSIAYRQEKSRNSSIQKLMHAMNAVDALAQHVPIASLVRTIIDYGIPTPNTIDPEEYIPQLIARNIPFPRMQPHTKTPRQAHISPAISADDSAYALAIDNGDDNNNSGEDDQKENTDYEWH